MLFAVGIADSELAKTFWLTILSSFKVVAGRETEIRIKPEEGGMGQEKAAEET